MSEKTDSALVEIYGDLLPEDDRVRFARELDFCLRDGGCDLTEICAVAQDIETDIELADRDSHIWDVFYAVVDMLEPSAHTARRLYDCFMKDLDDFNVFIKLYCENFKYLTERDKNSATEKAKRIFDKNILEIYGI